MGIERLSLPKLKNNSLQKSQETKGQRFSFVPSSFLLGNDGLRCHDGVDAERLVGDSTRSVEPVAARFAFDKLRLHLY
jgi:hypothetical protein